ncbi:hypothetical protein KOXY103107_15335 [Komagataeibacter xylinus]
MDKAERAGQHRNGGKAVDDEARRIIQQAFAFQQRRDPLGQDHVLEHGLGRYRIGRGDNGAQHETPRPRHGGNKPVRGQPHGKRGERNAPHRKLQDAKQVHAKRMPDRKICPRQQKRRQEHDQHQVRIDFKHRQAGGECYGNAAQHKGRSRWQAHLARGKFQPDDEHDQQQNILKARYIGHEGHTCLSRACPFNAQGRPSVSDKIFIPMNENNSCLFGVLSHHSISHDRMNEIKYRHRHETVPHGARSCHAGRPCARHPCTTLYM